MNRSILLITIIFLGQMSSLSGTKEHKKIVANLISNQTQSPDIENQNSTRQQSSNNEQTPLTSTNNQDNQPATLEQRIRLWRVEEQLRQARMNYRSAVFVCIGLCLLSPVLFFPFALRR